MLAQWCSNKKGDIWVNWTYEWIYELTVCSGVQQKTGGKKFVEKIR